MTLYKSTKPLPTTRDAIMVNIVNLSGSVTEIDW